MKLFISHASEDKADFVRPLAEALRREFEVWYDEYELTMGDSLLRKINDGLASSDYGVVVLSPSFFQKRWPQAELDGLFALEGTSRKMILPIWKDLSFDDVKRFSPILAGRLGSDASEGIEKVVNDIRKAIEVSERTKQISASDSVIKKAQLLDLSLKERSNGERLSRCEEGVAIVAKGFEGLCTAMQSSMAEAQKTSELLKFNVQKSPQHPFGPMFRITTIYGLGMEIHLVGLGGNYTHEATLHVIIYGSPLRRFSERGKPDVIRELDFKPTFRLPNQSVWLANDGSKRTYSIEELAALLLETLLNEGQRRSQTSD